MSLDADDQVKRWQNPKKKKKTKNLKWISNYTNGAGYKVNIQKPTPFLYNSSEQMEFETKNKISVTLALKEVKSLYI